MGASGRRRELDILRGAVMVLMALDHVRILFGVELDPVPSPALFLTRWVTHFCAPVFVFLAGTGAFLHARRLGSRGALSRYLLVRGVWLIVLELTLVRLGWTFNLDFGTYLLAGVIWVIGWSLIVLAGLVHLPLGVLAALGIALVAGHGLLDGVAGNLRAWSRESDLGWIASFGYTGGVILVGGTPLIVLYTLVPWVGVIACGFAFGALMEADAAVRRRWCVGLGAGLTALFLVLRFAEGYGDPRPWSAHPPGMEPWIAFLGTSKYPASLQFLAMTLGPALLLLPVLERARGAVADALDVFGRVPLFYYLLHLPVIHGLALLAALLRNGSVDPWLFANHPLAAPDPPAAVVWSLPVVWAVTALVVVLLYFPCRGFARVKAERRSRLLSYL